MTIYDSPEAYRASHNAPSAVTIGMFDGVHKGHRKILSRTVSHARSLGVSAVAYTFTPHPHYVMRGRHEPFLLTSDTERLQLLSQAGVDVVIMQRFTRELAGISPDKFVTDMLVHNLQTQAVVIGFSHVFGRGGEGTPAFLKKQGSRHNFITEEVEPYTAEGSPVSSTVIRHCVRNGQLERAATLLGRAYHVHGTVAAGDGRGRTLGAPTANITPAAPEKLVPGDGIYIGKLIDDTGGKHNALIYCGHRPTYEKGTSDRRVEVHVPGFTGDLYGRAVTAVFNKKLRDDRTFGGSDELAAQIRKDIKTAHKYFTTEGE